MKLDAAQIVVTQIQILEVGIQANALKQLTGPGRCEIAVLEHKSLQMALIVFEDFTNFTQRSVPEFIVAQVQFE